MNRWCISARRLFSTTLCRRHNVQRASDDVDVCIVGAGPSGLSAAIRLKQLEKDNGNDVRVVVLEKGPDLGSHNLSGAVIEPRALNELIPDWPTMPDHPLTQSATSSSMRFLTSRYSIPIPHPPQMSNKGNYIVSLSRFTRWLSSVAEEVGVEIYPGFAGASLVYGEDGQSVLGVITNDVGLDKHGHPKGTFEPGMQFNAKVTLLAEGAHGSLSKALIRKFNLDANSDRQTYGIGIKEVWRVDPSKHEPGKVVHTVGWPLDWRTYGGSWVYHMADGLVSLGMVIGLDYANPYLSPYNELQRMKHHPYFKTLLSGDSARVAYGARSLTEGGLQSIPQLHFPGGALIGCSAGFMNVAKIKGTHNAMKSGMLAAEVAYSAVTKQSPDNPADMSPYSTALRKSWIYDELHEVRNLRPSFHTPFGIWGGLVYSGFDSLLFRGRTPWTFHHPTVSDAALTRRAIECKPIAYPQPQPPLSTDLMTSVALTGTNHEEDQPVHLRIEDAKRVDHVKVNVTDYAGLLGRACPAGVYEYVDAGTSRAEGPVREALDKKLVINSQNCIHCKLCDIKVPTQDITWTVPEGGGGPKYSIL